MNIKLPRLILLKMVCIFMHINPAMADPIDSLKKLLSTNLPDSTRVDVLNALSKNYLKDNLDTAVIIAGSAKKIAGQINYQPGIALALKNIGNAYYMHGVYKDAIINWQQAHDIYKAIGDKVGVANMLSNQGAVYFNRGDEAKSLELHLQSLKIAEEINDTLRVVTSLTNIGGVYSNKNATLKEALDYFQRSYNLSLVIKDDYLIGTAAGNLGEIYYKIGKDTTALRYLYESAKRFDGTEDMPYALNYIGRVYTRQQIFDKAIANHTKAYEISKKLDTKHDLAQSLIGMAQAYFAKGDINTAIKMYKESLEFSVPLNDVAEIREAYEGLTKSYSKISDFENAFKYQDLLLTIKDTIYNIDTDQKLGKLLFGYELEKKENKISLLNKDNLIKQQEIKRQKLVKYGFIGGFAIMVLFAAVFFAQRNRISKEKKRSDELLLNILPAETAEELKETGTAKAKSFDMVSVLFTDFKNFTQASEKLTPEELVAEINHCYSAFDRIIGKYGIEKIKTIGDSYMCAAGLPATNNTHPEDIINAALEMVTFIEENKKERISRDQPYFELRLGVHSGPVVAGIVGIKKFAYDIWGDTVNTASRMESSGQVGKVNISGSTYELVKDKFICTHRGKVQAKNKGEIDMYFVESVI